MQNLGVVKQNNEIEPTKDNLGVLEEAHRQEAQGGQSNEQNQENHGEGQDEIPSEGNGADKSELAEGWETDIQTMTETGSHYHTTKLLLSRWKKECDAINVVMNTTFSEGSKDGKMVIGWGSAFQLISDDILKTNRFPTRIMQIKKWYAEKLAEELQDLKRGNQSEEGGWLDDDVLSRALFPISSDKEIIFPKDLLFVTAIKSQTGRGTARIDFLFGNKMRKFSSEVPTVRLFQDDGIYCKNPNVDDVNAVLAVLARDRGERAIKSEDEAKNWSGVFPVVVNLDLLDNAFDNIERNDIWPESEILHGTPGEKQFAPWRKIFFLLYAPAKQKTPSEFALIQVGIESYQKDEGKGIYTRAFVTTSYDTKKNKAIRAMDLKNVLKHLTTLLYGDRMAKCIVEPFHQHNYPKTKKGKSDYCYFVHQAEQKWRDVGVSTLLLVVAEGMGHGSLYEILQGKAKIKPTENPIDQILLLISGYMQKNHNEMTMHGLEGEKSFAKKGTRSNRKKRLRKSLESQMKRSRKTLGIKYDPISNQNGKEQATNSKHPSGVSSQCVSTSQSSFDNNDATMMEGGNRVSVIPGTMASPLIIPCSTANKKAIVPVNETVVADVASDVQKSQITFVNQVTHSDNTNIHDNGTTTSKDDGNNTPLIQNSGPEMVNNNNDVVTSGDLKDSEFTMAPNYTGDASGLVTYDNIPCSTANEKAIVPVNETVVADVASDVQKSQITFVNQVTHSDNTNIHDNGTTTSKDDGNNTPLIQNSGPEMVNNNNDVVTSGDLKDSEFTMAPNYTGDASGLVTYDNGEPACTSTQPSLTNSITTEGNGRNEAQAFKAAGPSQVNPYLGDCSPVVEEDNVSKTGSAANSRMEGYINLVQSGDAKADMPKTVTITTVHDDVEMSKFTVDTIFTLHQTLITNFEYERGCLSNIVPISFCHFEMLGGADSLLLMGLGCNPQLDQARTNVEEIANDEALDQAVLNDDEDLEESVLANIRAMNGDANHYPILQQCVDPRLLRDPDPTFDIGLQRYENLGNIQKGEIFAHHWPQMRKATVTTTGLDDRRKIRGIAYAHIPAKLYKLEHTHKMTNPRYLYGDNSIYGWKYGSLSFAAREGIAPELSMVIQQLYLPTCRNWFTNMQCPTCLLRFRSTTDFVYHHEFSKFGEKKRCKAAEAVPPPRRKGFATDQHHFLTDNFLRLARATIISEQIRWGNYDINGEIIRYDVLSPFGQPLLFPFQCMLNNGKELKNEKNFESKKNSEFNLCEFMRDKKKSLGKQEDKGEFRIRSLFDEDSMAVPVSLSPNREVTTDTKRHAFENEYPVIAEGLDMQFMKPHKFWPLIGGYNKEEKALEMDKKMDKSLFKVKSMFWDKNLRVGKDMNWSDNNSSKYQESVHDRIEWIIPNEVCGDIIYPQAHGWAGIPTLDE